MGSVMDVFIVIQYIYILLGLQSLYNQLSPFIDQIPGSQGNQGFPSQSNLDDKHGNDWFCRCSVVLQVLPE